TTALQQKTLSLYSGTPRGRWQEWHQLMLFAESGGGALTTGSYYYEIYYHGYLESNGRISVSGTAITFTCTAGGTFTATISGDNISFAGDVVFNDGSSQSFPGNFSRQNQGGANPFIGTWYDTEGGHVVATSSTWAYSGKGGYSSGTYTYIGNTATYYVSGESYPNVTTIVNGVFHTQGLAFSKNG
uniref:hypothetical protein n=1 Tax=Treponema endosymbiont of Eucomonympha sp. TaxID=1580831 RepID=UPI000A8637ED